MQLLDSFKHNWEKEQFAAANTTVLLAVSGGVDSMVMADLFLQSGIPIALAHCNYQLRGNDSELDEQLVAEWAEANNIRLHTIRFNTKQKCEEWKKGVQETARILRYEWLDAIRTEFGYSKLATAHHANDNAETLLMNLFKGTGIAGMHGIRKKNGSIIRPLLFATRNQIAEYAASNNVAYRTDASNNTDDYLRNAVRHQLVPAAENLFPDAVLKANETINRLTQVEEIYRTAIEQQRKKLVEQRGADYHIPILKLQKLSPLETLCYELFLPFGFTADQLPEILKLLAADSGKYILSATHRLIRNRDFIVVTSNQPVDTDIIQIEGFPCSVETAHGHFHFTLVDVPEKIPTDANIAFIDIKRITFPLLLRKWSIGDYFYPLGMGLKKKKISKYFKDQKFALQEKERVWILECDSRIAWVAGHRLDERFKITPGTSQAVRIDYKPLKN
jgi:tRNA(Ile)-lysidine synthase